MITYLPEICVTKWVSKNYDNTNEMRYTNPKDILNEQPDNFLALPSKLCTNFFVIHKIGLLKLYPYKIHNIISECPKECFPACVLINDKEPINVVNAVYYRWVSFEYWLNVDDLNTNGTDLCWAMGY